MLTQVFKIDIQTLQNNKTEETEETSVIVFVDHSTKKKKKSGYGCEKNMGKVPNIITSILTVHLQVSLSVLTHKIMCHVCFLFYFGHPLVSFQIYVSHLCDCLPHPNVLHLCLVAFPLPSMFLSLASWKHVFMLLIHYLHLYLLRLRLWMHYLITQNMIRVFFEHWKLFIRLNVSGKYHVTCIRNFQPHTEMTNVTHKCV